MGKSLFASKVVELFNFDVGFGLRDGGSDIETLSIFLEASALTLADAGAHLLPDLLRHGPPKVSNETIRQSFLLCSSPLPLPSPNQPGIGGSWKGG